MINPLLEIGKDEQCILWQPHLLTEAMASRRLDDLALEPVLNPAGVSGAAMFKVKSDESAVKWAWGNWKRVEIRAEQVNGLSAPLSYAPPRSPVVEWNELTAASAVELTFYGADDTASGRVKVEVPDTAAFGRDVEFEQPRGGAILVKLLNAKDSKGMSVERLTLGQKEEYKLKGGPLAFRSGELHVSVPAPGDFFGIVAVIKNRHRRRLIGYAHFDGRKISLPNLSQSVTAIEFQKIRRWIEGAARSEHARLHQDMTAEEWLENWPANSRNRLRYFSEQARRHINLTEDDTRKVLRAYSTGLLRYLTIFHCGYKSSNPERIIRRLNEGSFQAALNEVFPHLGGALASLKSLEERTWAIQHADNPNLVDAATWAGQQGVGALERALHLLDKRSEARASWEARQAVPK